MERFRALTLFVLRHGECEHNAAGWAAGHDDTPLTARGREQALANGRLLARHVDLFDTLHFYASPLHRACATMELVRQAAGLPMTGYRADRRLMEGDLGDHSRLKASEMLSHAAFIADPWNYVRPNGESQAMVHERVGRFLTGLTADSVIVTHALPITMIRAHYLGLSPQEAIGFNMGNAGLLRLADGGETLVEG